jgi:hypothetical protein
MSMDARYPLGQPGKLRELLPGGVAPCLLVSPTYRADPAEPMRIADVVADVVGQIDGSGQLLRVVTGAFAHDDNRPREIDGNVGAAEIALFEFNPRPSMIVRFEGTRAALTAHARITHVIRTVDDEALLETPVARLAGDALEFAAWRDPEVEPDAHLTWERESLSDSEGWDPMTAFGTAIALFAVSISSVYWRLQGVRWRIAVPSLAPLNEMFKAAAELVPATQAGSDLTERLNQELAELTAAHVNVEVLDLNDEDSVGVCVPRPPRAVTFVVGRDYPTEPPRVLVTEADGTIQEVRLDSSQWEPSRSMTDLLEAFA